MRYGGPVDTKHAACAWCGRQLPQGARGRPRKFCRPSCRQRAYEQRQQVSGTKIAADSVIMRPEKVRELGDRLFELRCAAEDVATAAEEGAPAGEIRELCTELVILARTIENLRM